MKYSPTVRILNVVLFALLGAAFLFLGCWFGFSVGTYQIVKTWAPTDAVILSPALCLMLSSLGWAGGLLSIRGLVYSIISVAHDRDDKPVVESFCSYIGIGFLAVVALLLNATWLIALSTANIGYNDVGFLVAAYVVIAIVLLVVSNVPVLKLFDEGEQSGKVFKLISQTAAFIFGGALIPFAVIGLGAILGYQGAQNAVLKLKLVILLAILAVATVLSVISFVLASKDKEGKKITLPGALLLISIALFGGFVIVSGVFEHIYEGKGYISLIASEFGKENGVWFNYAIGTYIVGGILIVAPIIIGLVSKALSKKKK